MAAQCPEIKGEDLVKQGEELESRLEEMMDSTALSISERQSALAVQQETQEAVQATMTAWQQQQRQLGPYSAAATSKTSDYDTGGDPTLEEVWAKFHGLVHDIQGHIFSISESTAKLEAVRGVSTFSLAPTAHGVGDAVQRNWCDDTQAASAHLGLFPEVPGDHQPEEEEEVKGDTKPDGLPRAVFEAASEFTPHFKISQEEEPGDSHGTAEFDFEGVFSAPRSDWATLSEEGDTDLPEIPPWPDPEPVAAKSVSEDMSKDCKLVLALVAHGQHTAAASLWDTRAVHTGAFLDAIAVGLGSALAAVSESDALELASSATDKRPLNEVLPRSFQSRGETSGR